MSRAFRALGIRPIDVAAFAVVLAAVELNLATATGPHQAPLNAVTYLLGAVLAAPVILRRRWPFQVLLACSILLFCLYTFYRRNISPAPLLCLPLYDAALAGYLAWSIVIPAAYMMIGLFVVGVSTREALVRLAADFLPSAVLLALAIALGEVVRGRRALAAETAERLRAAREEQESEAARQVAEERLRIARDLHDTVAHSMATITVQAGSALHLAAGGDERLRSSLAAIRDTSKHALAEMRATLGQLREGPRGSSPQGQHGTSGLDRLPDLRDAVTAAGVPVTVSVAGERRPLPDTVDQAAYRILQESLTNVLRHAGPAAQATVCLRYEQDALAIRVADSGSGQPATVPSLDGGHGLTGMAERAAAVGGEVRAGPLTGGGFEVVARLPAAGREPG